MKHDPLGKTGGGTEFAFYPRSWGRMSATLSVWGPLFLQVVLPHPSPHVVTPLMGTLFPYMLPHVLPDVLAHELSCAQPHLLIP